MNNTETVAVTQEAPRTPVFARVFAVISLVLGIFGLCYQVFAAVFSSIFAVLNGVIGTTTDDGVAFAFVAVYFGVIFSLIALVVAIVGLILGAIAKKRNQPRCSKAGVTLNVITLILSVLTIAGSIVLLVINLQNGMSFDQLLNH